MKPLSPDAENRRERYMALVQHRNSENHSAFAEHVRKLIGMMPSNLTQHFDKISPPNSSISIACIPPEIQSEYHHLLVGQNIRKGKIPAR